MTTVAHHTHRWQAAGVAFAAALAGTVLGSASPSRAAVVTSDSCIPVVEVTVTAAGISGASHLRPGITTFHTTSTHPGTDSLAVVRLNDGVGYAEIYRYLQHGDLAAVFRHVSGKGGIAHGSRHNGRRWTANLTVGRYLYVDDEANLLAPFDVRGPRQLAPAPDAKGTIVFTHGVFRLPPSFGSGTWRLHNRDSIQHEFGLLRITGGHTRADVLRAIKRGAQPAWVHPQGTVNLIGPGETAWVTLHDIHGFYVLLDYLPLFQGAASGPVVRFRRIPEHVSTNSRTVSRAPSPTARTDLQERANRGEAIRSAALPVRHHPTPPAVGHLCTTVNRKGQSA